MSRMKSLTSFLVMALVISMVSFAHAQTASTTTSSATDAAKKSASTASKDAHSATSTASKDTKSAATTETKKATTETKKATTETKKEAQAKATDMAKYDLNSATKDELMKVPGIGAATADKIIAGRPWKQKSDLVNKGIMNKAMYDKASPYMIAKQATAKK